MKKFFLIFCLIISLNYIMRGEDSDQIRIAVFDPASSGTSIDDGTKIAVREIISSTIVNTGKYSIVERSLLEKIMEEQKFSNSGAVNDLEATEIGKLAGANKVVLSVVTLTGGRNMVSIKIIDVTTATIERQKVKVVTSGELLNVVEPLTLEMLNLKSSSPVSNEIDAKNLETGKIKSTDFNPGKINVNKKENKLRLTPEGIKPGMKFKEYNKLYVTSDYQHMPGDPYRPWVAGLTSFFIPGLGQMICGEVGRGFIFFGSTLGAAIISSVCSGLAVQKSGDVSTILNVTSLAFSVGILVVDIYSIIDAIKVAKIKNMYIQDLKEMSYSSIDMKLYPSIKYIQDVESNLQPAVGITFALNF